MVKRAMHFREVKGILSASNGMNLSRGCIHGCIYCDSRSKCYNMEHDFEDVEIKSNAPELLEDRLKRKRKKCMVSTGAMSDPYMSLPESLAITRACLEIIEKMGFGLAIQTKSNLILRDLYLLKRINKNAKCVVQITLTTFDEKLCKIVEPNVSTTRERFEVLKIFHDNNIPAVVWLCPILPFINDTEENLLGILNYCIEAKVYGILCFGMGLTLREGDREYYYKKLDVHFPGLREKYIREYGNNYELFSGNNRRLIEIFEKTCKAHNIVGSRDELFKYMRTLELPSEFQDEKVTGSQLSLF
jgi:DNA repair photolyase